MNTTLDLCLQQLEGYGVLLRPTEVFRWAIGSTVFSPAGARSAVALAGLAHVSSHVCMSVHHVADGIYAVDPQGHAWMLFSIVPGR